MGLFRRKKEKEKKPPNKKVVAIFLAVFMVAFLYLTIRQWGDPVAHVQIRDARVRVEVAHTPQEQRQGLGGRLTLKNGEGMLFIFATPGQMGFWMRGMHFPIDIVWMYKGVIIDIASEVPPPTDSNAPESDLQRYYPRLPADMVLEVPAGYAGAHGWKIGDSAQVTFDKE